MLSPKALFRLIKMSWPTLTEVGHFFKPYKYVVLTHYNDRLVQLDMQRYLFVVMSWNEAMPIPLQRTCLHRQAGLATYLDDYLDSLFLGIILRVTWIMRAGEGVVLYLMNHTGLDNKNRCYLNIRSCLITFVT